MIVVNKTGSSLYVSELEKSFAPEREVKSYFISSQDVLKSISIRNLIRSGFLEPIEIDTNSSLEKDLLSSYNKSMKNKENNTEKIITNGFMLRGQFLDYSGYAKVNRNLADCLIKNKINLSINALDYKTPRLIGKDLEKTSSYKYVFSNCSDLVIDSIVPSSDNARGKEKSIIYTTVESYSIPDSFSGIFNRYDEIWVTSNFCKEVISKQTKKHIEVIPGIVNCDIYNEKATPIEMNGKAKSFKFISVFNWNYRKGPDALIKAYCNAFDGNDDVSLILLCRHRRISGPSKDVRNDVDNELKKIGHHNPPHILRVTKELDEYGIASLYRSCNAFVLPSRGEGYGLPYLEASLCGLPVIGTNVSAIADILSNDNSLLVDIDRLVSVPSGATGCYFWDDQLMADLTSKDFIQRLSDSMKDVYFNYQKYVEKNKVLQKETLKNASSFECFSKIKERIKL